MTELVCKIEDCERTGRITKGMCTMHYERERRSGNGKVCSVDGCNSGLMAKGLCGSHYYRWRNDLILDNDWRRAGKFGPWWKNAKGYMQRRRTLPDGTRQQEFQHRVVMEEMIGRPLLENENVHHRNGDRADNSPENLQLWSTKQPKGQHWVDKLQYAREIIALYEPLEQSGFDDGECAPRD